MSHLTGRVVGSWLDPRDQPVTGYVLLELPKSVVPFYDSADVRGLTGQFIRIPLVHGSIDATVPATNDPNVTPRNWAYKVTYLFTGQPKQEFYIAVPAGETTNIPFVVHLYANGDGEFDAGDAYPAGSGTPANYKALFGDGTWKEVLQSTGTTRITVSDTAPLNPAEGDLWLDTSE